MLESIISLLIYICVIAIVIYLVIWVLTDVVGLALPPKIIQILWVIFALIVIWLLVRMILPMAGHGRLLGSVIGASPAQAASFYPACLKPDGDWVHGLTPSECRQVRGRWYTANVLKKARKVW